MRCMLDTDICIYTISERPAAVLSAFRQFQSAGLGIWSVTAAELFFGVARTGSQRNPYDSLIAAHAHALGVTLVSSNTREFALVPGLKVENWAAWQRPTRQRRSAVSGFRARG